MLYLREEQADACIPPNHVSWHPFHASLKFRRENIINSIEKYTYKEKEGGGRSHLFSQHLAEDRLRKMVQNSQELYSGQEHHLKAC